MTEQSPTRDRILDLIKKSGMIAVSDLTQELGITPMAVRGHLGRLEKDGIITSGLQKQKRGRPQQVFSITDKGENSFPKRYNHFAADLMRDLRSLDEGETLKKVLDIKYRREMDQRKEVLKDLRGQEKIQKYAELITVDGYMAKIQKISESSYQLVEHNCAILDVAKNNFCCCEMELEMLQGIFSEASVTRVQNQIMGNTQCAYQIDFPV